MNNHVIISLELANRIVGYLSRQPYADVVSLIADISRAANSSKEMLQTPKGDGDASQAAPSE